MASYLPVDNVKVPSISEAPATVVVVVPISYVQPLLYVSDPDKVTSALAVSPLVLEIIKLPGFKADDIV